MLAEVIGITAEGDVVVVSPASGPGPAPRRGSRSSEAAVLREAAEVVLRWDIHQIAAKAEQIDECTTNILAEERQKVWYDVDTWVVPTEEVKTWTFNTLHRCLKLGPLPPEMWQIGWFEEEDPDKTRKLSEFLGSPGRPVADWLRFRAKPGLLGKAVHECCGLLIRTPMPWDQVVVTVAHEHAHLCGADEAAAEGYGHRVLATFVEQERQRQLAGRDRYWRFC